VPDVESGAQAATAAKWEFDHVYVIRHPDGTEEKRDVAEGRAWSILNELGLAGWELVDRSIWNSTIVETHNGWSEVSHPIGVSWLFKRRLSEGP